MKERSTDSIFIAVASAVLAAWTPGTLLIFVPHTPSMLAPHLTHVLEIELMLSMINELKQTNKHSKPQSGNTLYGRKMGMDG